MNAHALQACQMVDRLVGNWRAAPPVRVVEIVDDLPCKTFDDVRGIYRLGEAWIVANACTKSEVVEVVGHEVIGHHGLRAALGSLWRPFMQALHAGARSDHRLSMIQRRVTGVYVDGKNHCCLSPVQQGDEMAAHLAEWRIRGDTGRLDIANPLLKVSKAAVGQMSRETLYLDSPATFEQLEGALVLAEHKLRYGGHFWGVGFWARRWYAERMPKFDPKAAPMSLDESERLLKNARDSDSMWNSFVLFLLELPIVFIGIAFFGCLLAGIFWLVRVLGSL